MDAKAEGNLVVSGVWKPVFDERGGILKERSPWFLASLDESSAPGACWKGLPFKTSGTPKPLANLVARVVFGPVMQLGEPQHRLETVTGATASMVAENVVAKGASARFPVCARAMELSAQLEGRGASLALAWTPRYWNEEAVDLTNNKFEGASEELRVPIGIEKLPWRHLPRITSEGMAFYNEMKAAKLGKPEASARARKKPKGDPPRWKCKDPWRKRLGHTCRYMHIEVVSIFKHGLL